MKGIILTAETFIVKFIADIIYYEFIWIAIKKGWFKIQNVKFILKILIYLNIMLLVLGTNVHIFMNLYFLTLWYLIIYPDRIINELTEEQAKAT